MQSSLPIVFVQNVRRRLLRRVVEAVDVDIQVAVPIDVDADDRRAFRSERRRVRFGGLESPDRARVDEPTRDVSQVKLLRRRTFVPAAQQEVVVAVAVEVALGHAPDAVESGRQVGLPGRVDESPVPPVFEHVRRARPVEHDQVVVPVAVIVDRKRSRGVTFVGCNRTCAAIAKPDSLIDGALV